MLEKDIDFGGAKISAVGTASKPFCGYFDGNGHVLKNAVIQNNSYAGLFGYAEDRAQIRDLSAEKITVSGKYAGGSLVNLMRYLSNAVRSAELSRVQARQAESWAKQVV